MTDERYETGLSIRKEVLGEAHVERSLAAVSDFSRPVQEFVTRACWGDVWSRPGLDRRTRSLLNLVMLTALGRNHELGVHVRGAITNGATEAEIQEAAGGDLLGISRPTVREVLRQLAVEGLVTVVPQRGAVVTALSPDDAADLYEMRASLEALSVRRFVQRPTPEHVAALRAAVEEIERTAASAEPQEQLLAKDRFYEVLFTGSGSAPLQQTVAACRPGCGCCEPRRCPSRDAPRRPRPSCGPSSTPWRRVTGTPRPRPAPVTSRTPPAPHSLG